MNDEVVIREASVADAADVARLLTELNRTVGALGYPEAVARLPENADVSSEQAASRLQRVSGIETVLLAFTNCEAAGLTSLRLLPYLDQDTPFAEITQMHVSSRFQRLGIASGLITAAEERAQAAGATCVHLITGLDNDAAQTFYRRNGYVAAQMEFEKYLERQPAHA